MDATMLTLTLMTTALIAVAMIAATGLRGFTAWIDLKRAELQAHSGSPAGNGANRIELADVKERIRKLEAIAAGVDL